MQVSILTGECHFRALLPGNLKLYWSQLVLPLGVGLIDLLDVSGTELLPGIVELDDCNRRSRVFAAQRADLWRTHGRPSEPSNQTNSENCHGGAYKKLPTIQHDFSIPQPISILLIYLFALRDASAPRAFLLLLIEIGKLLAEMVNLRRVIDCNVRVVRMKRGVILMIGFGGIECLQWNHLGDNRTRI